MSNPFEICMTLGEFPGVNHFSFRQEHKLVEQCDDIATRLMNSEYDSTIVAPGECDKALNNIESIESVKSFGGNKQLS